MTADCGLCGRAEVMLRSLQKKIRFDLELVDIGLDDQLFRKHWDRIPVVLADGAEVAAASVDEKRLKQALSDSGVM